MTDHKQKTSNDGMDELPENEEQARSLVISLGLFGRNGTPKTPQEQLLAHVYESHRIGRSMNKVSFVLFGESGVGKSSTVNHLFGKEVAKTASEKSETRDSKEFQIVYPDEEAKMKLTLSIIDTPGFNDSKGMSQDACNLFCIEQFFAKFHKGNKEIYPNLVFLLLKADDNRFSDDNSVFSKNLRVIQKLGLIDQRHPNVVVILTHAFSALFSPKKRENVKNKTEKINDALFQICRIRAPVVCIENDFKDLQLEEEGDYSRLPNDELQPKNLYEKMVDVLEENGDRLGHAVLNQCFQKIDKTSVLIGENTTANDGFAGTLNSREMVFKDLLQKNNDVGAKGSEVGQEIQRYLDINGMVRSNLHGIFFF